MVRTRRGSCTEVLKFSAADVSREELSHVGAYVGAYAATFGSIWEQPGTLTVRNH